MVRVCGSLVLGGAPQGSFGGPPTSMGAPLFPMGEPLGKPRRPFVLVGDPATKPRAPLTSMGGCAPRLESRKVSGQALLERSDGLEVRSPVREPEPSGLPDELEVLQPI